MASAQQITFVTEHLPPFQIVEENKAIDGFATEVLRAAMKLTPYSYTIEAHPWSLSYTFAQKNNNTCIYSIARIPSRESLFQWAGEITKMNSSFYAHKDSKIKLNTLEDAKNYVVAVVKDDFTHHLLLENGFVENKNFYALDNTPNLLRLLNGRKDIIDLLILGDSPLRNNTSVSSGFNKYKKIISFEEMNMMFNIACSLTTDPEVVHQISSALTDIKQQGTFSKIERKWIEISKNEH
jgi:polar amino acid transport system substrate-binding protein